LQVSIINLRLFSQVRVEDSILFLLLLGGHRPLLLGRSSVRKLLPRLVG